MMVERAEMLRELIGQLEEVHGSPPPAAYDYLVQFQSRRRPTSGQRPIRCCAYDIEATTSMKDSCQTAAKSENMRMLELSKPPTKKARKERNRANGAVSGRSTKNMDSKIWKEFPEDLYEAVIARVPIAAFFRFRSVCQKWNSLLTSESFFRECAQKKQTESWFYTITHEDMNAGSMYDPSSRKWYHPTPWPLPLSLRVFPVASAGGLICFLDLGHRNFYICNPLTQCYKLLPPRSLKVWSRLAVGMTLIGESAQSGYKIMWVGCDGEYETYDSTKKSWFRHGNVPPTISLLPLGLNFRSQVVSVGSTLYFMRCNPDGILSYEMETGIWKQFLIPLPRHLSDQTLAECEGRIMLVGLLTKNAATCVCIWELQKMTLLWKEVDRMPNLWCLEFYGKHVRMSCLGNKGLLMLSLRSRQKIRLVTYDMMSREWMKVPGCVLPSGKRKQCIASGTAFHPCLTASP